MSEIDDAGSGSPNSMKPFDDWLVAVFGDPACMHGQDECRYRHRDHKPDECGIRPPAFETTMPTEQMGFFDE